MLNAVDRLEHRDDLRHDEGVVAETDEVREHRVRDANDERHTEVGDIDPARSEVGDEPGDDGGTGDREGVGSPDVRLDEDEHREAGAGESQLHDFAAEPAEEPDSDGDQEAGDRALDVDERVRRGAAVEHAQLEESRGDEIERGVGADEADTVLEHGEDQFGSHVRVLSVNP